MERQICTFEEWISSYFDYPATKRLNDFGNGGIRQGRTDPAIETEYVVRAFENPRAVLWQFSNEQLGGGLWKMLNGANGDDWTYPFLNPTAFLNRCVNGRSKPSTPCSSSFLPLGARIGRCT